MKKIMKLSLLSLSAVMLSGVIYAGQGTANIGVIGAEYTGDGPSNVIAVSSLGGGNGFDAGNHLINVPFSYDSTGNTLVIKTSGGTANGNIAITVTPQGDFLGMQQATFDCISGNYNGTLPVATIDLTSHTAQLWGNQFKGASLGVSYGYEIHIVNQTMTTLGVLDGQASFLLTATYQP